MSCFFFKQICTEKKKIPDHNLYHTVTLFNMWGATGAPVEELMGSWTAEVEKP